MWIPWSRKVHLAEVRQLSLRETECSNQCDCRRILTEKHGYRIAVIMNEFGDTAVSILHIDQHLSSY